MTLTTSPPVQATPPARTGQGAFSTRGELYRFHKANGSLHEYYRMFGLD